MSYDKQSLKLASDMSGVLNEKQRQPNYSYKKKKMKMIEDIDNISPYVKRNLRGQEHR
jgi:hypothetical protein